MDDERLQTTAMLLSRLHEEQIVTLISYLAAAAIDITLSDVGDVLAPVVIALENAATVIAHANDDPNDGIAEAWAAAEAAGAGVPAESADYYDGDVLAGMMTA